MKIDYLSYSSAKLYLEGCQRLFWERKVNNHRTAFDAPYFARGKALHKCLEIYYTKKMNKEEFTKKDFDAIMAMFGIIKKKSVIENYQVFEHFVTSRNYEQYEIIEPELAFDIYTESGIRLKGFIDLVLKKDNTYYIVDFKSDVFERDYSIQKVIYSVAIRNLFKADKYIFVLDFLATKPYEYEITDEEYEENVAIIDTISHGISLTEFEDLEYRPGAHCASCPQKVLKTCPFYKQAFEYVKEAKSPVKKITKETLEERENIMNMVKILSSRKDSIDDFIKKNAEKEGYRTKKNELIKVVSNKRSEFDFKRLYKKFGSKIFDAASLTVSGLKTTLTKEEMMYADKIKETRITGSKITVIKEKK